MSEERVTGVSGRLIAAAIEVHHVVGPGLLESIYEECLCRELSLRRVSFERPVEAPVTYKNADLGTRHRLDMLVEGFLVVELKSVERLLPIHQAQVLTELRLCNLPLGLLINFNVPTLKAGIKRVVNDSGFDLKKVMPHRPAHQENSTPWPSVPSVSPWCAVPPQVEDARANTKGGARRPRPW